MNKIKLISIILLITLSMTACQDSEKGKLDNRVNQYWENIINQSYGLSYEFLTPAWRKNESKTEYIQRMNTLRFKWETASFIEKKCMRKDRCKVIMDLEYTYRFASAGGAEIRVPNTNEFIWVLIDNVWYTPK